MRKTGFLNDNRYKKHITSSYHPETPARLDAIYTGIDSGDLLARLHLMAAEPVNQKWIEAVHHVKYISRFEEACLMGMDELDYPDNQMCRDTYEIAVLSTGGVLAAVREVMNGNIDNAFCAVRPPGHHAEINKAMGFCYFNNIAIAATYLKKEWNIERVGILDFDVHHGNGTQHIFEEDPTVFYYSIHEHPSFAFPGTGREFERGAGAGEGYTLNSPMLPGFGDGEYRETIEKDMMPAFDSFKPQVLLVSTGFDAHEEDDMSGIRLSTSCFTWIMERIMEIGDAYSDGRVVSILEGGYCLKRLPELARNHVQILMNSR